MIKHSKTHQKMKNRKLTTSQRKQMSLKRGSYVLVFSDKRNTWLEGSIVDILHDREGEWLVVSYDDGKRTKQVQRFSDYVVAHKRSRQETNSHGADQKRSDINEEVKSVDRASIESTAAPKRSDLEEKEMNALKHQLNEIVLALTRRHYAQIDEMQKRIHKLGLPQASQCMRCCSQKASK